MSSWLLRHTTTSKRERQQRRDATKREWIKKNRLERARQQKAQHRVDNPALYSPPDSPTLSSELPSDLYDPPALPLDPPVLELAPLPVPTALSDIEEEWTQDSQQVPIAVQEEESKSFVWGTHPAGIWSQVQSAEEAPTQVQSAESQAIAWSTQTQVHWSDRSGPSQEI